MAAKLKNYALALIAVAVIQTGVLGWMIWDRIALLNNGREIVLSVIPVDPRSIFRGDYVILNYQISRIEGQDIEINDDFERNDQVYVLLQQQDDKSWQPRSITRNRPDSPAANQIALQAKIKSRWRKKNSTTIWLKYGIESYFIEEGQGRELEKQVGEKKIAVLLAVGSNGETAIKGLMLDDKLVYEEPLF